MTTWICRVDMDNDPQPELPANLKFLARLVTVLTAVMILGVIAIVALLVIRLQPGTAPEMPAAITLPDGTTIRVHDSTADMRYIVIPARPEGTDGWDAARLATLVTRDSMIGTGLAKSPDTA